MLDRWITWSSANIQPDAVSVEGGAQNAGKPAMSSGLQVLLAIGATLAMAMVQRTFAVATIEAS